MAPRPGIPPGKGGGSAKLLRKKSGKQDAGPLLPGQVPGPGRRGLLLRRRRRHYGQTLRGRPRTQSTRVRAQTNPREASPPASGFRVRVRLLPVAKVLVAR